MRPILTLLLLSLLSFSLLACGDDDTPADAASDTGVDAADAAISGAVATFEVPAGETIEWGSVPFPNDVFLGADGTINMSGLNDRPMWQSVVERINSFDGFCRSCPLSFPITGQLDSASMPPDATPTTAAAATDAIVLMRLDGTGGFIPVVSDWSEADGLVMVRAAGLRVLPPETAYVAALTSALMAADGTPLQASAQFAAVRDEASGPTPEADRARTTVGPALDALEAAGVTRASIVSLAVFTTRDTSTHVTQIAAIVDAAPTPTATVDRVFRASDGTLDALLGTPEMDLPGRDNAAAAGTEGETAIVHDAIDMVILGSFEAPRIVEGTGTDIGFVRRGPDGTVEAGPQESVPFALVIPVGADVTDLPIAFAHCGNPGTRTQALLVGNMLAREGIATISTDPFQMGARAPSATDAINDFRSGDLPADGFSEIDTGDLFFRSVGVSGGETDLFFHPGYYHGFGSQLVSDGVAGLRFLQEGDVTAIAAEDAALTGLAFRSDEIFWLGLSFGSWTGMSAVTARPGVAAAVFNVGPGSVVETACNSPEQRPGVALLFPGIGIEGTFDEVDRHMCRNHMLGIYRMLLEDVEPQSSLHYMFRAPLHATSPDVLFQYVGYDENISSASGELAMAESGVPFDNAADELTLATVQAGTAPFVGNVTTPNGTITAGGWYFPIAGHVAMIQQDEESTVEPPIVAPFVLRDTAVPIANPIVEVNGQITAFFTSRQSAGQATISAPPTP